jgi:hypothetical protein
MRTAFAHLANRVRVRLTSIRSLRKPLGMLVAHLPSGEEDD